MTEPLCGSPSERRGGLFIPAARRGPERSGMDPTDAADDGRGPRGSRQNCEERAQFPSLGPEWRELTGVGPRRTGKCRVPETGRGERCKRRRAGGGSWFPPGQLPPRASATGTDRSWNDVAAACLLLDVLTSQPSSKDRSWADRRPQTLAPHVPWAGRPGNTCLQCVPQGTRHPTRLTAPCTRRKEPNPLEANGRVWRLQA